MRKIWVIALREYSAAVRTKAFVIGLVVMPLLMGGGILVQHVLKDFRDTKEKHFAVIDRSPDGRFFAAIQNEAAQYNRDKVDVPDGKKQLFPRLLVERVVVEEDTPEAIDDWRVTLSDRVRDDRLTGFVEIGPDVGEQVDDNYRHAFRYQTNRPTHREFPQLVRKVVNETIQEERARKAKLNVVQIRQILTLEEMTERGLSQRNPQTHKVEDPSKAEQIAPVVVPMALMLLMFMMVMMSATPMMQGVVEEKMQRIAEVLLGSVRPFELMLGKLVGMTGVSLTMAAVYLGGVYWAARQFGVVEAVRPGLIVWFILFQALAGLMYGSLFIAIGAACTDMKETQNLLWPVMLLATMPMFVLGTVLQEPNSPVVTGLSFFPFATPMLMIARLAIPPGPAWWQPLLGLVLGIATTLFCVWAAGRVFRVGLLMQGKGARLGELVRWVFRG